MRLESAEPNPPDVDISLEGAGDRISTEALARAEDVAKAAGVKYELDEIYGRNVAAAIAKEASAVGADHIIIGSTGHDPACDVRAGVGRAERGALRPLSRDGGQIGARVGPQPRHGEERVTWISSLSPSGSPSSRLRPCCWDGSFSSYFRRDRNKMEHMLDPFLSVLDSPTRGEARGATSSLRERLTAVRPA